MNKMHALPSLTEEQIVKALECCMAGGLCHEYPCYSGACVVGGGYALALIQRQKEEIERLTDRLAAARADAVREFGDRVLALFPCDKKYTAISRATIKQIAQMTEGEG